ncbi:MAG TPA: hypothetical protein VNT03_00180 [Baekduia sp.]|nr:hypothetical protein [Baekduia sp.]
MKTPNAMVRWTLISGCVLAVAATAGCGTAGDRDQARTAAQTLYAAVQRHDGDTACAQMSPSLRAQLVKDEQARCAKAVLDLDLRGRTVAAVRVYANTAQVRLERGDTVFLGDTNEGWRVEALGCRPQGEGPYDCEAES